MLKTSEKRKGQSFWDWQKAPSLDVCACGCGGYISNRAAKSKAKGLTDGYIKGHKYKGKTLPEEVKQKMRDNHADFRGKNNPNYGKPLLVGASNPNWQGGKVRKLYSKKNQKGVNTKQDLEFRKSIKERDGKCIVCDTKDNLSVHHIDPWVSNESLRFAPENCVTLCKSCHCRADHAKTKDMMLPILKGYINGRCMRKQVYRTSVP